MACNLFKMAMAVSLSAVSGGFLAGCTAPQHIRSSNYYYYNYSLSGLVSSRQQEAMQHHPVFAGSGEFLEGPPNYSKDVHYFLFGMLPREYVVSLKEACGDKPFRQAYSTHSVWQSVVSFVTLGIYTPRRVEVWCGEIPK